MADVWVPGNLVDLDALKREYDTIVFTRAAIRKIEECVAGLIGHLEIVVPLAGDDCAEIEKDIDAAFCRPRQTAGSALMDQLDLENALFEKCIEAIVKYGKGESVFGAALILNVDEVSFLCDVLQDKLRTELRMAKALHIDG